MFILLTTFLSVRTVLLKLLVTFAFAQLYDILSEKELRSNSVDCSLESIRLQRSRIGEKDGDSEPTGFYGTCPLDSTRGPVHIFWETL